MDFQDRLLALDSAQLKILIAEILAGKDLDDKTRQYLNYSVIETMASNHPQAALAFLLSEASDLFKDGWMGSRLIYTSLGSWAKDDPMAALEWVRKNGKKFPDLVNDNTKEGMISGAATNNPKLAFQLIGQLGVKDTDRSVGQIIDSAKTAEQRTSTLAALRGYLAKIENKDARENASRNALQSIAESAAETGFEAGSKWIEGAGLAPSELVSSLGGSFEYRMKSKDTGKWLEWIDKTLPPGEESENVIRSIVSNWTREDYQAAGKWLAATPDGPTKNQSIRAYVDAISEYEPESAAEWAMTLPAGKERTQSLQTIYENWPRKDEASRAAAEAFKARHGIE
ncbi:MAG: hypothetical protein HC767_07445 [Akkermansiaceae bacterium]|nr:hypothetical protein [Akkermansiaceae bacterium]